MTMAGPKHKLFLVAHPRHWPVKKSPMPCRKKALNYKCTTLKHPQARLEYFRSICSLFNLKNQYEFVTGPLPPLEAVDALIATRETITNIASKYGLRATLAPRIFMDSSE